MGISGESQALQASDEEMLQKSEMVSFIEEIHLERAVPSKFMFM